LALQQEMLLWLAEQDWDAPETVTLGGPGGSFFGAATVKAAPAMRVRVRRENFMVAEIVEGVD